MTAPARLAHIVFRTNQMAAMRDWYCTVLEAHVDCDALLRIAQGAR